LEPNTPIAAGLGISWLGAKLIGLDTDYLIVGMVGSLLAAARSEPRPFVYHGHYLIGRTRQTAKVVANLCAVSFFAAASTTIGVILFPGITQGALAVAGLVGFFGHPAIVSVTEFISRAWRVMLKRMGGSDADTQ
jgi:hypothetical protein